MPDPAPVAVPLTPDTARAWVDVNLEALVANARAFQHLVNAPLLPMVKASGYGLGAQGVVRALEQVEPWGYGVATIEEGAELRAAGIARPILVFTPLLPALAPAALAAQVTPCIENLEGLRAWTGHTDRPFHVEIDTGMHRAGFLWNDADGIARLADALGAATGWEGVYTHFHSAEGDLAATRLQYARLLEVVAALGRRPRFVHAAGSAGGLLDTRFGADVARPGMYLYGGRIMRHAPHPVAALRARVVAVRRVPAGDIVSYDATWTAPRSTTIATLAIGYADGLPRTLGSRGRVEINGQLHTIAGRVTMDLTMVDVGEAVVRPGDVATLYGGLVTLDEQAEVAGTISYELLTRLGPRVVRRYR
jgi:alanine racemase